MMTVMMKEMIGGNVSFKAIPEKNVIVEAEVTQICTAVQN